MRRQAESELAADELTTGGPASRGRAPITHSGLSGACIPWSDVLRFYVPLAATSVLMMVTHNVISGAVSRTYNPAAAIAAYSTAYSVGQIFESPCYTLQRMGLTFGASKRSVSVVMRVGLTILAVLASAYALTAWTPLVSVVFKTIMKVPDEVYPMVVASFRVFIMWPVASAIRSLFQPRIVLAGKTYWMTVAMGIRVLVMLAAAYFLPGLWPEGPVGAVILVAGITTEALLAWVVAKFALPPPDAVPDEPSVTASQVTKFGLPLAIASIIQMFGKPVLTAILLRTLDPTNTVAGWQVSLSFSYILVALTFNIYHVVVVFVKDARSFRQIQSFCLGLGLIGFVLMGIVSGIPQLGTYIFEEIIGSPPAVSREAVRTLRILTLSAPAAAAMEFYSGILLLRKRSATVTLAKMGNTAASCLVAIALVRLFPGIGASAGAAALAAGPFLEAAISYRIIRTSPEFADLRLPGEAAELTVDA